MVFQDQPRIYRDERAIPPGYKYLKNPDLKQVRGIPMHMWRIEDFGRVANPYASFRTVVIVSALGAALLASFLVGLCLL